MARRLARSHYQSEASTAPSLPSQARSPAPVGNGMPSQPAMNIRTAPTSLAPASFGDDGKQLIVAQSNRGAGDPRFGIRLALMCLPARVAARHVGVILLAGLQAFLLKLMSSRSKKCQTAK